MEPNKAICVAKFVKKMKFNPSHPTNTHMRLMFLLYYIDAHITLWETGQKFQ